MHFFNYEKGKFCEWLKNALPQIENALKLMGLKNQEKYLRKYFENGCWTLDNLEYLWKIPLLIHEMNPDYKMVIRHRSVQNYTDTVLYAE